MSDMIVTYTISTDRDGNIYNEWFMYGWHAALERAARRLETANDETSRQCIAQAIRNLMP